MWKIYLKLIKLKTHGLVSITCTNPYGFLVLVSTFAQRAR